jgi:probable HAF family extracellular repeat protein
MGRRRNFILVSVLLFPWLTRDVVLSAPLYTVTDLGPATYPNPSFDGSSDIPVTIDNNGQVNYRTNGWTGFSATAGGFTTYTNTYNPWPYHPGVPVFGAYLQRGSDPRILVLPTGYAESFASGLNSAGLLVGQNDPSGGGMFIYSYATRDYLNLRTLNLGPGTYYGINDQNQLVGLADANQSQVTDWWGNWRFINSHAWLTSLNPGTLGWGGVDLNQLIPGNSGWTLTSATGINNLGQIVGYGVDPQGDYHAYELTPVANEVPEPSMLALLCLAGAGIAARRLGRTYRARRTRQDILS